MDYRKHNMRQFKYSNLSKPNMNLIHRRINEIDKLLKYNSFYAHIL
jgi:hypothetical protein